MRIGDRTIDAAAAPYVIAEIGVNHDGSPARAAALVDAAIAAGADAVKFQLFTADHLLSRAALLAEYQHDAGARDARSMLAEYELSFDEIAALCLRARDAGRHAIVSVFSIEHAAEAGALPVDALKSASPDVVNRPLLQALAATGLPLLVSTGGATLEEVRTALGWLGDHPVALFQCVSAYPTPDDEAHLAGRQVLAELTPSALGYSDHTTSTDTGALAVASGARILEKHFTHDRTAPGPDHAASLDPDGFAAYVRGAHRAWRMLGKAEKDVLPIEADVRHVARQSITTTRALAVDHVIVRADLTVKRPGTGIEARRLDDVVGRTVARAVEADVPLCEEDLA